MVQIVLQCLKIVTIAVTAVLIVAGGARAFDHYLDEQRPNDIGRRFTFTVEQDDTIEDVVAGLQERDLIRYEWTFEAFVRIKNADLVPGQYQLKKGMSAEQLADLLTGGSTATASSDNRGNSEEAADEEEAETVQLTVIEGWRTEQIAEQLVEIGWDGSVDDFMEAVEEFPTDNYEFLVSRDNEVNPDSLEGFLFPATYEVRTDEPAQDIVQKMLMAFDEQFTPDMREHAQKMNLSIYQVLTFAALVEREAQVPAERPVIADVFLKRWSEGWRLESDPTARYGVGKEEDGDWWDAPSEEQLLDEDNPYNTYQIDGLPPGPICNPGVDAIKAVLTPDETQYWYFVAHPDESGRHLFAADEASQNQNINFRNGVVDAPAPGSDPFESGEQIPIQPVGG
ncbi:MAG: endolytic transglycosylase MltG [Thermomicrobiales bacterium]